MSETTLHVAERFRAALEAAELESPALRNFPKGACTHASRFLSQYLFDNGLGDWALVSGLGGAPPYSGSHAWLTQNDLRLDVTADQFDGSLPSVWLTDLKHPWYSQWRVVGAPYLSRMEHYDPSDLTYLSDFRKLETLANR